MFFAEIFIEILLLFGAISSLSLPVAVIGFAVGAYIGSLNRTANPNMPLALGVIAGAISYAVAETIVLLVTIAIIGGLIVAVFYYRPIIERSLNRFAQSSGRQFASRNFTARGTRVTDEFSNRQAFLDELPIEPEQRNRLRKKNQSQFCNAIEQLGTQYPYVPNDVSEAANGSMSLEDRFNEE